MVRLPNPESAAALGTRLAELNQIGVALSQEKNLDRLLEAILLAAKKITNADGGTLYRHPPGQDTLTFEIIRTDSLGIAMGGTTGVKIPYPPHPAARRPGPREHLDGRGQRRAEGPHRRHRRRLPGARASTSPAPRPSTAAPATARQSFLTVPMKNHEGEIIGVLQLINAQDRSTMSSPFSARPTSASPSRSPRRPPSR
jgi:GAF domain-containing protein